jgi:general nucleoside transport system permease protein
MQDSTITSIAGMLALAGPLIFAVIGEIFTEKAGIINLSLNGTILLSAMSGFVVAISVNSLPLGFLVGGLVGMLVALIVAFASISLKQSQIAVGFVLALLCRDLAYFIGNPFMGSPGIRVMHLPIPGLADIPLVGPIFFNQNVLVYASYLLIILSYLWIFKTRPGLMLQGIGEKPMAAFIRGVNVNRLRYLYAALGGFLVGLAGPMYSLSVKVGWKGSLSGLDGLGWIALAITIFGAWNPLRAAFGVYLFVFLQWLGIILQPLLSNFPSQVLQVAPFPLMILTLLLVNIGDTEWVEKMLAPTPEGFRRAVKKFIHLVRSSPPGSLGVPFDGGK